jgi:hypothetical protein
MYNPFMETEQATSTPERVAKFALGAHVRIIRDNDPYFGETGIVADNGVPLIEHYAVCLDRYAEDRCYKDITFGPYTVNELEAV